MKQPIWIAIIAALAFAPAACSKKSDDAGKGGAGAAGGAGGGAVPTCAEAITKAVNSLGGGSETGGVKDKLQAILTPRCTEDKWPAEVIQCYASAAGMQGMSACRQKLPPEQATRIITEIRGVMAGAAGAMGGGGMPPPGHGGAPAGSGAAPAAPGGSGAAPAPAPEPPK